MENTEVQKTLFNPELYRDKHLDFVHVQSLTRIVSGQKPSDITTVQDAKRILSNLETLRDPELNVVIREIDNPSVFTPLQDNKIPLLGGAFDGECLRDYQKAAERLGVIIKPDPQMTLRLD